MKQQSKLLKVISILLIIFGAFGLIGNLASIFLIGPMMNTPEMAAVYEAAGVTQPGTMYYVFSIVSCLVEIAAGIVGVMYRSKKSVLIAGAVWTVVVIIGMIWGVDFNGIASEKAIEVIHKAFDNHLILEVAGRHDGVVKIMPPLTIEDDTLMEGLQIVKKSIAEVLN